MTKVTLNNVGSLIDATTAATTINNNTAAIVTAFDNTLSRDGTNPNKMAANLDMNSNRILNLPLPSSLNEPLRLTDANTLNGGGTITVTPLPTGGTVGQVLEKNSSTNYDASWQTVGSLPTGGTSNQILQKNTSTNFDASWQTPNILATPGVPARQAILSSTVNTAGFPGFANPGTGLNVNLTATATPIVLSYAAGWSNVSAGALDFVSNVSADTASYWGSLPASQYSFLAIDRNVSTGATTPTQTLVRPQKGPVYQNSRQALLHFEGSLLDDWGNTWSSSNSSFSSSVFKFGTQSLRLSGANPSLAQTTNILNPGQGNWTIDVWSNVDNAVSASIFSLASAFGVYVATNASSKPILFLSSSGTSWDIANGLVGGSTVTAGTFHHWALSFDGSTYRLYLDGVQQVSVTSASIVWPECAALAVGYQVGAAGYTAGYWDELSFVPYARWVGSGTFTPPTQPYSIAGDWFDTNAMVMKTATAAGPTWSTIQRLYVAEAQTGASSVSAVYNYSSVNNNSGYTLDTGSFKLKAGKKVYYIATPQFMNAFAPVIGAQNTFLLPPNLVPPDAVSFSVQTTIFHAPINGSNYQDISFNTRLPTGVAQNYAIMGEAFALYSGMGTANPSLAFTENSGQILTFPVINGIACFEGELSNVSAPSVQATITAVLLGYELP